MKIPVVKSNLTYYILILPIPEQSLFSPGTLLPGTKIKESGVCDAKENSLFPVSSTPQQKRFAMVLFAVEVRIVGLRPQISAGRRQTRRRRNDFVHLLPCPRCSAVEDVAPEPDYP